MPDLDSPVQVTDTTPPADIPTGGDTITPIDYDKVNTSLTNFFGFTPSDELTEDQSYQLKFIWNHFAPKAESEGETIRLISQMERELAAPHYDETRLGKLYTYVRLLNEEESLKDELSAYKKRKTL